MLPWQNWSFTEYWMKHAKLHDDPGVDMAFKKMMFYPDQWFELLGKTFINGKYEYFFIKPLWTGYSPIINIILISLFILILGLTLPQRPKYIKFLNLVTSVYILVSLYSLSFNYIGYAYFRIHNFVDVITYPFVEECIQKGGVFDIKDESVAIINEIKNQREFQGWDWSRALNNLGYNYGPNSYTFNWYPNGTFYANLFFIISSLAVVCLLLGIADRLYSTENNKIEFLILVIFIYLGSVFLMNSGDFICALILLECIAFSSYILVGFERKNKFSASSGIKYLILGAVPGGFFVLGVVLLYKDYGSFFFNNLEPLIFDTPRYVLSTISNKYPNYIEIVEVVKNMEYNHASTSTYVAILLILTNLLFKLTAAPLHMWAPSIYGEAPLATTTFLSIFSKLTIFFFSVYLYTSIFYLFEEIINPLLITCGILSIYVGILGAFSETLIKRFFVYSSMGHVGFMLLGVAVTGTDVLGLRSAINYLLVYVVSSYILWILLMYLTKKTTHLTNLKALCINHPVLSFIFSITMFSLSGIPPLAGFFVKFEIFYNVLNSGNYFILLFLFILTVFSFFYYLRVIKIIYFENNISFKKNKNVDLLKLRLLSILAHFLLFFIIFVPEPFLVIIEKSIEWLFYFK